MKKLCALVLLFASKAHAADAQLTLDILMCESSLRANVCGDDGISCGIAQFRRETFNEFAHQARKQMMAAKMWPPKYMSPTHQIFLLDWALDKGKGRRWTCYRKIKRGGWKR